MKSKYQHFSILFSKPNTTMYINELDRKATDTVRVSVAPGYHAPVAREKEKARRLFYPRCALNIVTLFPFQLTGPQGGPDDTMPK